MTKATAKYVRTSSRKVRRVINEIRGKHVTEAKTILKFMPYAASFVVAKVLNSAIANAKENENLSPDKLKISNAFVNDAPVLKRWRAVSRGRGFSILKRNSHITIEVVPLLDDEIKPHSHKHHVDHKHDHDHTHETKVDDKATVKESKPEKAEKKTKSEKIEKKKSDVEKSEDKKKIEKKKKKEDKK